MIRVILFSLLVVTCVIISNARAAMFNQNSPLASPADGNVFLFLDDLGGTETNRFVAVNTGVTMTTGSTYNLIGAVGDALGENYRDQSIQMWRNDGTTGTIDTRAFLGQEFSTSGTWVTPADGDWADNNVSYVAGPSDMFKEIIILLTNFNAGPGVAYWDNFRITENGSQVYQDSFEIGLAPGTEAEVADAGWDIGGATVEGSGVATAVPEPASLSLLCLSSLLLVGFRQHRK